MACAVRGHRALYGVNHDADAAPKRLFGLLCLFGTQVALSAWLWISTQFHAKHDAWRKQMDSLIHMVPVVGAIGYSIVYLLAGGGVFGAFVIFVVAKMLGR
jgi:hypothetical protein